MVGRGEAIQARSRELSQRLKEDMISQLPDHLIWQILSHFPIEDAVRTSVLSTRCKSLWLWVPSLELSSRRFPEFNAFKSFGDRFFDSSRASSIHKLILDIYGDEDDEDDASYLTSWIDAAVKRKVQHLRVGCSPDEYLCEMPISLYICETLVSLKLYGVNMADAEYVSFRCLKSMHLKHIFYPNEAAFEKLVSSCPVLEYLKVIVARNDAKFYRVHSRSLKKLFFIRASPSQLDFVSGVVIDAPILCCLSIYDNVSDSITVVNNRDSNTMLGMSLDFGLQNFHEASDSSRRSRFRSFLPGISRVRNMAVESDTFKLIHDYSKFERLPQLPYASCMVATICVSDLKCFPSFLESCPNLKLLYLWLADYEEMRSEELNQISYSSVPECLLRSLVFVGFKAPISGLAGEMKLVKYFLENSAILKKLTLHVNRGSVDYDITKELLKIPIRSATCQVVVVG